jgi:MFS family permease
MKFRISHLALTACLSATVDWGLMIVTLMFYVKGMGGSTVEYTLLAAGFMTVQFISVPVWGRLSDLFGRKRALLFALAGSTLSIFFLGISKSLVDVFIARLFGGLFGGSTAILSATVADISPAESRAKYLGYAEAGVNGGLFLLGPLASGKLYELDPHFPYFFGTGLGLLNILSTLIFFKSPSNTETVQPTATAEADTDRILDHCFVFALTFGLNLVLFSFIPALKKTPSLFASQADWILPLSVGGLNFAIARFVLPYAGRKPEANPLSKSGQGSRLFADLGILMRNRYLLGGLVLMLIAGLAKAPYEAALALYVKALTGWSPKVVGEAMTIFGVTLFCIQTFLFNRIVNRIGEVKTALVGLVSGLFGNLLMLLFGGAILPQSQATLFAIMVVDGIGLSLLIPSAASIVAKATPAPNLKGTAMGAFRGANSLGKMSAPISGFAFDRISIHAPFLVAAASWTLGIVLTLIWSWAPGQAADLEKTRPDIPTSEPEAPTSEAS